MLGVMQDALRAILRMDADDILCAHKCCVDKGLPARINLLAAVIPIWKDDFSEIRLHRMSPGKTSSHHSHGYHQVSFCVKGAYEHELFSWKEESDPEIGADTYRVMSRCGSTNPPSMNIDHVRGTLTKDHVYGYTAGQAWALDYPQVHDLTVRAEGCWTVNFRMKSTPRPCVVYHKLNADGTYDRPEWLPAFLEQNLQVAKDTVEDKINEFVKISAMY